MWNDVMWNDGKPNQRATHLISRGCLKGCKAR